MTTAELRAVIERLRRSTRNADVLDICDALESRLATEALDPQSNQPLDKANKPPFDKRTYQRDLMRKRRAEEKRRRQQESATAEKQSNGQRG